jgi:hypothetical protein
LELGLCFSLGFSGFGEFRKSDYEEFFSHGKAALDSLRGAMLKLLPRAILVSVLGMFIAVCGTASGEVKTIPTPEGKVDEVNAPSTPEARVLPTASTPQVIRGDDVLLQFESMLQSEAKAHREYLEKTLDTLKWAVGIFGTLAVVAFTWLNYKSGKDIRTQVNSRFRTTIDALVDKRVAELDALVHSNRERLEANMAETNAWMGRIGDFAAVWSTAFTLLEQPTKDERYELARRDAQRQLEALRPFFPHWRHLGILLARLHVHFGDYEAAINLLTEVIAEREKRNLPHGIDYAALLYSRACYKNRLAEKRQSTDEEGAEQLRTTAWNDLKSSIKSDSGNFREAMSDVDLTTLWNNTNRKKDSLEA